MLGPDFWPTKLWAHKAARFVVFVTRQLTTNVVKLEILEYSNFSFKLYGMKKEVAEKEILSQKGTDFKIRINQVAKGYINDPEKI